MFGEHDFVGNFQRLHSVVDDGDGRIKSVYKRSGFGFGFDAHTYMYAQVACVFGVYKDDSFDKDKVNIYFGLYIKDHTTHSNIVCMPR